MQELHRFGGRYRIASNPVWAFDAGCAVGGRNYIRHIVASKLADRLREEVRLTIVCITISPDDYHFSFTKMCYCSIY